MRPGLSIKPGLSGVQGGENGLIFQRNLETETDLLKLPVELRPVVKEDGLALEEGLSLGGFPADLRNGLVLVVVGDKMGGDTAHGQHSNQCH